MIIPREGDLLLVTDIQRDFCAGGALAVPDGDAVVPLINLLMDRFPHVAATQDWHPPGHFSFASAHPGHQPFDSIVASYGPQTLWPDHCVQGSPGAELHPGLRTDRFELIIRKGFHPGIDSYSTFLENDRVTKTGLDGYMRERGFTRIFCVGLALDYCVRFSAEDARHFGFEAYAIVDACRAIDQHGSLAEAQSAMDAAGVRLIASGDIATGPRT
ncbi:MAG: bifunctional nicotinamidase/pyrazinamidase [Sphingomonadales bacterium]